MQKVKLTYKKFYISSQQEGPFFTKKFLFLFLPFFFPDKTLNIAVATLWPPTALSQKDFEMCTQIQPVPYKYSQRKITECNLSSHRWCKRFSSMLRSRGLTALVTDTVIVLNIDPVLKGIGDFAYQCHLVLISYGIP